ncbi:DUF2752 domain-containing protein [Nocardioides aequoreus]|uniref:DUF2752 domain-containing protein n=1 Tax=Nocardioides aequoreus TaxID=397278 RepID=UPI0005614C64|nr:DUF2752 domain-containing protein [Nocardioides aequoreus]
MTHAPVLQRSAVTRLAGPLLTGGVAVAGAVALHLRDPNTRGSWGYCPVSLVLGVDCPGCGSLRAVHALTDLDVVAAASSNLMLTLAVPVALVAWVVWLRRAWRPRPPQGPTAWAPSGPETARRLSPALVWAVTGVAVVAFTVLRNLPAGAWLHS